MFIKLTIFRHHRIAWEDHGRPIYVAVDKIALISRATASLVLDEADLKIPTKDRKAAEYSCLTLAFYGEEGPETQWVCETTEEILKLIQERIDFPGNPY